MDEEKKTDEIIEQAPKRRGGRKPKTAEKMTAAAEPRAKGRAKAESLKPAVVVQFQGSDVDVDTLLEAAKADFRQARKRTRITDLKLYVKPEERMAYYVVNEKHSGSVSY